jgi:hypothetical protein
LSVRKARQRIEASTRATVVRLAGLLVARPDPLVVARDIVQACRSAKPLNACVFWTAARAAFRRHHVLTQEVERHPHQADVRARHPHDRRALCARGTRFVADRHEGDLAGASELEPKHLRQRLLVARQVALLDHLRLVVLLHAEADAIDVLGHHEITLNHRDEPAFVRVGFATARPHADQDQDEDQVSPRHKATALGFKCRVSASAMSMSVSMSSATIRGLSGSGSS